MRTTSALYCPGNRPDRFEKAFSAADQVILDLQDSVAPDQKAFALDQVINFLTSKPTSDLNRVQVRVESTASELAALEPFADDITIRLSRVEKREDLIIWEKFRSVIPLVETSLGILNLREIAEPENVVSLAMGELDLTTELDASSPELVRHLRIQLVLASAAFGLPAPMMSAWTKLSDADGFRQDCIEGRSLGFWGRTAVHPSQLTTIHEIFAVAEDSEVEKAETKLLLEQSGGVALDAKGNMIDQASVRGRRLRRL